MGHLGRSGGEELRHWFLREQDFEIIDRLVEVANTKQATPAQIALAWLLSKPVVTAPVVGVTKMQHLEEAVAALEITLTEEDVAYLEEPYQARELIGHYGGQPAKGDHPGD